MIDSHCHLDVAAFDADRDAVLARAGAAGVHTLLVPAIRPATWDALTSWAATPAAAAAGVHIALGIHPQIVPALSPAENVRLDGLPAALTAARAVAVGECGLDGATADPAAQERLLAAQVAIARDLRLPLIIHVLRAHDRAPALLRAARAHEVGGVMHSYSGGAALVPVYRDLGFAFSFTGAVTWPGSRRPVEAARAVPADLLLVETDAPDQTPVPHRPGRSEPAQLPAIIAALASARETTPENLAALTTANARRLFRL